MVRSLMKSSFSSFLYMQTQTSRLVYKTRTGTLNVKGLYSYIIKQALEVGGKTS